MKLIVSLSYNKVSKSFTKYWGHRNLPEIHFVPRRDNGLLGVNLQMLSQSFAIEFEIV